MELNSHFLALPAEGRSNELNRRFLSDPAVLLAACVNLKGTVDKAPLFALREGVAVQEWLSENWQAMPSPEEATYFAAELSWLLAAAYRQCGRYRECQVWLDRLERAYEGIVGGEPLQARGRYLRLAVLYDLRAYDEVVERMPALREAFAKLGMGKYVAKSRLLQGMALKESGHDLEARLEFEAVASDETVKDEQVRGLALIGLAELDGRRGRFAEAMRNLSAANCLVKEAGTPITVAHLKGIGGQLLRDQGLLLPAVNSYRETIEVYSAAGMASLAAYVRIILAETLLAMGREDQAIQEIVTALPTVAESWLVHEAVAAVALLRESIRRHKVDPAALRILREQLDRMRKGGEL